MGKNKGYENSSNSEEFNLQNELKNLVNQNIIPSRVAEKLYKKLIEKNVKISKNQLHTLAYKIREVINNYKNSIQEKTTESGKPNWEKSETDMQQLVEIVEKLEERITNIESGKAPYSTDVNITESSREWEYDPLKEVPNDPESIIVLMKWLQYLIDKCGRDNLIDILNYYVDVGWISEDAKINLIDYSHGITEEKPSDAIKKDVKNLPSKDHIQSLYFIEKLKGRNLNKHFIDKIDGELDRVMKKLNNYQFK